jgi:hypothetical protein
MRDITPDNEAAVPAPLEDPHGVLAAFEQH